MIRLVLVSLAVISFGSLAQAYIFNFQNAKVSSYLGATGGIPGLRGNAYADGVGSGNSVDSAVQYDYSGEIGFLFTDGHINFLLGGEVLETQPVNGNVTNEGGTKIASLVSNVYGIIGDAGFEFVLRPRPTNHFILGAIASYADVTMNNAFTMTSAGQSAYPSAGTGYTEEASGWGIGGKAYAGFEVLFTDNVTLSMALGYRYLPTNTLNYKQAASTINGSVSSGGKVMNSNGTTRMLDLSGPFLGLGLRFYFM